MAASVASLLTEAIQKTDLFNKLAQSPTVKAGQKAASMAAKAGGAMQQGMGGPGAAGADTAGKAMSGMAGMMGDIMPRLGKLASPTQLLNLPKKLLSKGMGLMGINLSLSTLLRQSQLFTGILGALFQILGGFVDVILAPFMPFFVGVIRKLASQIPKIREWAQKLHDWLSVNVFPLIKAGFDWIWGKIGTAVNWVSEHMPEIKEKVMGFFNNTISPALDRAKDILGEVWGWAKEHLLPTLVAAFFTVVDMVKILWDFMKGTAWPILKNIFSNLKIILEGTLKWLREDIYPLIKQAWEWLITEVGGFILWLADNIVERLTRIIPLIQSIITQVIDILLNSILKPLWAALEPILKWYVDMVMTHWEWAIGVIESKILPFIKDIIDDLMPHIQNLSEAFMEHVAPHIEAFWEAFRDFMDAFLDVALPIIKFMLKILWKVLEPLLKIVFKLVGYVFWILKWVLKVLTWLLRLPFTWKQTLLDPILSAMDWGFDLLKKAWFWMVNFPTKLRALLLTTAGQFLLKLGSAGKIDIPFAPDIQLGWLTGIGDKIMSIANAQNDEFNRKQANMQRTLSTSTGGMRQQWGTQPIEVHINNFTSQGVLDSTRHMQIDGENQRNIDNMQELEVGIGSYDSLPPGLK